MSGVCLSSQAARKVYKPSTHPPLFPYQHLPSLDFQNQMAKAWMSAQAAIQNSHGHLHVCRSSVQSPILKITAMTCVLLRLSPRDSKSAPKTEYIRRCSLRSINAADACFLQPLSMDANELINPTTHALPPKGSGLQRHGRALSAWGYTSKRKHHLMHRPPHASNS